MVIYFHFQVAGNFVFANAYWLCQKWWICLYWRSTLLPRCIFFRAVAIFGYADFKFYLMNVGKNIKLQTWFV